MRDPLHKSNLIFWRRQTASGNDNKRATWVFVSTPARVFQWRSPAIGAATDDKRATWQLITTIDELLVWRPKPPIGFDSLSWEVDGVCEVQWTTPASAASWTINGTSTVSFTGTPISFWVVQGVCTATFTPTVDVVVLPYPGTGGVRGWFIDGIEGVSWVGRYTGPVSWTINGTSTVSWVPKYDPHSVPEECFVADDEIVVDSDFIVNRWF